MPKTLFVTSPDSQSNGIRIIWTKSTQTLLIDGWYGGCVSIEGSAFSLREFFIRLGISEDDCQKVWKGV